MFQFTPSTSAAEQNCVDMAGLGVVSCLVGLLSSPDKTIRAYAALSLSAMTHIGIPVCLASLSLVTTQDVMRCDYAGCVRKQVLAADGLPPLLALLTPEGQTL